MIKKIITKTAFAVLFILASSLYFSGDAFAYDLTSTGYINSDGEYYFQVSNNMGTAYKIKIIDKYDNTTVVNNRVSDVSYTVHLNPLHKHKIKIRFKYDGKLVKYKCVLINYPDFSDVTLDEVAFYSKLQKKWTTSSVIDRKEIAYKILNDQCERQDVYEVPDLKFRRMEEDELSGYYERSKNIIVLNSKFVRKSNIDILPTIAHEVRHIYQYEYIDENDDSYAKKVVDSISNYTSTDINEYNNQFIEKDANKYSKKYDLLPYYLEGCECFNLNKDIVNSK